MYAVNISTCPLLSRLRVWAIMLSMALTFGMGTTAVQANASVLAHIACGDSELPDGGWVCNCEPGKGGCIKHIPDNGQEHGSDMVEMNHHHHGDTPSSTAALLFGSVEPALAGNASIMPARASILHGIGPSQADQPPKI